MRRLSFLFAVAGLITPSAWAGGAVGVVSSMTSETVELALAAGRSERPSRYQLRTPQLWIEFDTPFLRLVRKAATAEAQRQPVDASLATPDVTAPELRLWAGPEPCGDSAPEIKRVYLEHADGTRVEPRSTQKVVDYAQSVRRKKIALRGLTAIFPAEALAPGSRFHVVLSQGPEQVLTLPADWFGAPR